MNTYQPGQKVIINSHEYAGDYEECGAGIPLGSFGEYVLHQPTNAIYSHLVRHCGRLHPLADNEIEPLETSSEPGMRTVLIKGVAVPIIETGPYGPHILLDDDTYVTTGVLEKLGFEVRS